MRWTKDGSESPVYFDISKWGALHEIFYTVYSMHALTCRLCFNTRINELCCHNSVYISVCVGCIHINCLRLLGSVLVYSDYDVTGSKTVVHYIPRPMSLTFPHRDSIHSLPVFYVYLLGFKVQQHLAYCL